MNLSLAMITAGEPTLARVIRSAMEIVSEVILVAHPGTVNLEQLQAQISATNPASEIPAIRLIEREWDGNFSAARNVSTSSRL